MVMSLKAARVNAELTQEEAAIKLNIGKSTIQNYEQYKTKPDIDMAKAIAALYKTTVDNIRWNNV